MEESEKNRAPRMHPLVEAADISGFSHQYLRQLCRDQAVEHTRRGKRYFFTDAQVAALTVVVAPRQGNEERK